MPPAARWTAALLLAILGTLGIARALVSPKPQGLNPIPGATQADHTPPASPGIDDAAASPADADTASLPTPSSPTRLININTATAADLDLLPGIGPVTADRIIEYRNEHGPFRSLDDLDNITRIGPKTIADLAPYATAE